MDCVLVDFDSGRIIPGLIQFWGRSFKSTVFMLHMFLVLFLDSKFSGSTFIGKS